MAMNGKLGDIGFVELLKVVGKRFGRLSINAPNNRQYDWYIHDFRVFAVRINKESVKNIAVLQETALYLINDEQSTYSFVSREALEKFPIEMSFNLEQVIADSLTKLTTDAPCRHHFPNPETKFVTAPASKSLLVGETEIFWQRAEYFLMKVASAAEISKELNLALDYVRLELYRLRVLGRITPVRAFSAGLTTRLQTAGFGGQPQASTPQTSPVSSPSQIVNTSPTSYKPPESPPPQRIYYEEKSSPPKTVLTSKNPKDEERKTLIRRMLGSLFGR
jgi:hypothetical protein